MLGQNPQLIEFLECRPPPLQTPSGKCAKDLFATYLPSPDMWWPSRRKRSGCLSTLGWWWWSLSAWCTWCSSSASSSTSRTTGAISSSRTSRWATRPKWSKLYIIVVFFRKILIVDHGTIQRQVISYFLNRKNYLDYLDWPTLTLQLEIVLDIHNSTYMQDLTKKHPRKDQRQHIFKYLLVQVGTSVSLAEDDSGETL